MNLPQSSIYLLLALVLSTPVFADISVERSGSAACGPLIHTLKSQWMDVKHHMQPPSGDIDRPESNHFVCLSPGVTRNSIEKGSLSTTALKCYSTSGSRGLGVCCDERLSACAQLNPGLFPDLFAKKKTKEYVAPKSNWVKPPLESDQWGTN